MWFFTVALITVWSLASVRVVMMLSVGLINVHPQLLLRQDQRRTLLACFLAFWLSWQSWVWQLWRSLCLGGCDVFAVVLVVSILRGLGSLGGWVVVALLELAAPVVAVLF